jgi:glycosyltransferase involved in cell wall biosynthesis
VNLFEFFYHPYGPDSDMTFRQDLPWTPGVAKFLRSRCRNAMILLDLENCQAGYCPTQFQRSRFPVAYADRLRVIFDGVDTNVWNPRDNTLRPPVEQRSARKLAGVELPAKTRILTYCSRGFESMRGFDLFVRGLRRVLERVPDAHALVFGTDRVAYGGDDEYVPGGSFKTWAMQQDDAAGCDWSRVHFVGRQPPPVLAEALAASDAHVYLTVPFVLSWSTINAMACGAVVIGSDTSPVREVVTDGETGRLFDFFDPNALADAATAALQDPSGHRRLGDSAAAMVRERYATDVVLPSMLAMYDEARSVQRGLEQRRPRPGTPRTKSAGSSPFAG